MIERIKKIMQAEGLSQGKFAEEIGITNSRFSHYLSGRNNVTLEMTTNILERFRGINSEWLLFGRGEMYKNSSAQPHIPEQRDLFTPINNTVETKSPPILEPEVKETAIEEEIPHEKLVAEENTQPLQTNITNEKLLPTKTIEKIIVLYTDNTFDAYLPNGKKL